MILKNKPILRCRFLIMMLLTVGLFSCESDDTREVILYEKGQTEANASSTHIQFGESVNFTSTSTKALTTTWNFEGGSPASAIDPNVTVTYNIPGEFEAKLVVKYVDNTIDTKTFNIMVDGPDEPLPYSGTPVSIPGTIEAENYDLGGEGIAYHDTEAENLAENAGSATYRDDDGIDVQVSSDGSLINIGYSNSEEWVNYTINTANAGLYDFEFILASGSSSGGSSLLIQQIDPLDGTVSDLGETGAFANTGGWGVYSSFLVEGINLPSGTSTLRIYYTGGGVNFDKVHITESNVATEEGLAIYTERPLSDSNPAILPPSNNANFIISEVGNASEGNNALYYNFDPANSDNNQTWGAMASMFPTTPVNASAYNFYNISLKSTSTYNLRVRFKASGQNVWVTLVAADNTYGMERDGQWHNLKIPLADFGAADLSSISDILILRSDDADWGSTSPTDTERDYDWYVDDIYLSVD